uniref:Uncharacterized protein n=1 Tax=Eutreptiella gymnastica TaxID=73025 RepID=A0A7S4LJ51_9EUGL
MPMVLMKKAGGVQGQINHLEESWFPENLCILNQKKNREIVQSMCPKSDSTPLLSERPLHMPGDGEHDHTTFEHQPRTEGRKPDQMHGRGRVARDELRREWEVGGVHLPCPCRTCSRGQISYHARRTTAMAFAPPRSTSLFRFGGSTVLLSTHRDVGRSSAPAIWRQSSCSPGHFALLLETEPS